MRAENIWKGWLLPSANWLNRIALFNIRCDACFERSCPQINALETFITRCDEFRAKHFVRAISRTRLYTTLRLPFKKKKK